MQDPAPARAAAAAAPDTSGAPGLQISAGPPGSLDRPGTHADQNAPVTPDGQDPPGVPPHQSRFGASAPRSSAGVAGATGPLAAPSSAAQLAAAIPSTDDPHQAATPPGEGRGAESDNSTSEADPHHGNDDGEGSLEHGTGNSGDGGETCDGDPDHTHDGYYDTDTDTGDTSYSGGADNGDPRMSVARVMPARSEPAAGTLYLVGTPIGNLEDLSPRARRILESVERIACEDTRRSGLLLSRLGIRGRPLISFHSHNEAARIPQLLDALAAGQAIALISDAGLPGISDPGEALVAAARRAGRPVVCIPGPTALTTALVSSGLPTGRFCFEGFLPARGGARRQRLEALAEEPRTLIFYEAPHRLVALLEDLLALLGDRPIQVARELTKRHEQQVGPSVARALEHFRRTPPLGECTVVLGGASAPEPPAWDSEALRSALEALVASGLSRREAARSLAERSGQNRRALYALLHQPADDAAAEGEGANRWDAATGSPDPGGAGADAAE